MDGLGTCPGSVLRTIDSVYRKDDVTKRIYKTIEAIQANTFPSPSQTLSGTKKLVGYQC